MPFGTVFTGLSTSAIALLVTGGGLALTGLYLLRRRRTKIVVPFAALWFPTAGDSRAERRARRLRRLLSLALQLGIFALLVLAAADPKPAAGQARGRTIVILVDRSASMRALDEPGSRLRTRADIGTRDDRRDGPERSRVDRDVRQRRHGGHGN